MSSAVHTYLIQLVDTTGGTSTLDFVSEWSVKQTVGVRTDTFSFSVPETFRGSDPTPNVPTGRLQNQVFIYASNSGSVNTSSDLLIDGEVSDIRKEYSEAGCVFVFEGVNKTGRILSKQRPANITSSGLTSSIFNPFIESVNGDLSGLGRSTITWAGDNAANSATLTNYHTNYKPIIDHISTLSRKEYTGDSDKIFWIDEYNVFHWKNRPSVVSGTLSEGGNVLNVSAEYSVFDTVNFAVINAGKDDTSTSVLLYVHNAESIAKMGFKSDFILDEEIANSIRRDQPLLSGSDLRNAIKVSARAKWKDKLGLPTWKATVEVLGTNEFNRGAQYTVFSNTFGPPFDEGKALTVEEVRHTFTNEGWITRLEMIEEQKNVDLNNSVD